MATQTTQMMMPDTEKNRTANQSISADICRFMVTSEKAASAARGGSASSKVVSALSKRRLAKQIVTTQYKGQARWRLLRQSSKWRRQLQSAQALIGQAGHMNQTSICA